MLPILRQVLERSRKKDRGNRGMVAESLSDYRITADDEKTETSEVVRSEIERLTTSPSAWRRSIVRESSGNPSFSTRMEGNPTSR